MKVALFRGNGVISTLIRWQTRGEFSHAAILDDDGTLYEAWQFAGVRKRAGIKPGPGVTLFELNLTEEQKARVRGWWEKQIARGTKYDYVGVLRFVTRRNRGDAKKVFCSEAVIESLRRADVHLFAHWVESFRVHPDVIAWSPYWNQ